MKSLIHKLIIFLLFINLTQYSFSQATDFLFKYFKEKKTMTYGLNNRRTKLLNEPSSIYSGYIGIKFGNKLKHVITLNSTIFYVGEYIDENQNKPLELQLNYIGFAEEFKFWEYRKWSLKSYIHMGIGKGYFRTNQIDYKSWLCPLEFGLNGGYSPVDWMEIRGGVGYRFVFLSNGLPLNGMYYKLGAGINLRAFKSWTVEVGKCFNQAKRSVLRSY